MQSVNRGAMLVLLALAAVGLLSASSQLRAQQRGPAFGSHASAAFLAPPAGHHAAAGAATAELPVSAALRRSDAGESLASGASIGAAATVAAALAALGAARAAAGRRRTARRATIGHFERDNPQMWAKYGRVNPYPAKRPFYPGELGYNTEGKPKKDLPPPARMSLSFVSEAMATFMPGQFYLDPSVKLEFSSVKEVGTCQISPDDESQTIVVPAKLPAYVKPHKMGVRLDKEKGPKRPPLETEKYEEYIAKKCSLLKTAEETSKSKGFSLEKDFICDRAALSVLLNYLNETMCDELRRTGQTENPIDFVKISKAGKALVLQNVYEKKNLSAEGRGYRGAWKRSEFSNHGNFFPAWERLATGDTKTKCLMITGLPQIAGSRAGKTARAWRFVEYEIEGLKFLTRAKTHLMNSDGKDVELKHKNWYYLSQVTALSTYLDMLLGGVGMMSMAIHRSGKLLKVFETTLSQIVSKTPAVEEAAERRMGRLVSMLKKVKEAIEKDGGDGPWVLQWQNGELVLGEYKKVEDVVMEEKELEMTPA